jgi:Phosphotransferase enzyme family
VDALVPVDARIPALAAIRELGPAGVGSRLGLDFDPEEIEVLRHHPGSRCTLVARTGPRRVVLKAFKRDPAPLAEAQARLAAAGLAGGRPPTVAPLVGLDPELRLAAFAWLSGPTCADLVIRGDGARAGSLAATWLRAERGAPKAPGSPPTAELGLERGRRWAAEIDTSDGELGDAAARTFDRLAATHPLGSPSPLLHGALSVNHVFDLGDGPGVIDLERAASGDLELDAGRFLGTLSRLTGERPDLDGPARDAAGALRDGAADLLDPEALDWYVALALLQDAKFLCTRRPDRWRERSRLLLDEAAETLA